MRMRKLATIAFSTAKYMDGASNPCPDSQQNSRTAAMPEAAGKGQLFQPPPGNFCKLGNFKALLSH